MLQGTMTAGFQSVPLPKFFMYRPTAFACSLQEAWAEHKKCHKLTNAWMYVTSRGQVPFLPAHSSPSPFECVSRELACSTFAAMSAAFQAYISAERLPAELDFASS